MFLPGFVPPIVSREKRYVPAKTTLFLELQWLFLSLGAQTSFELLLVYSPCLIARYDCTVLVDVAPFFVSISFSCYVCSVSFERDGVFREGDQWGSGLEYWGGGEG